MISCAEAVNQLWDYLENDLDPNDRGRVEQHLAFCRRCCGEVEFAEELRVFLRSASRPSIPPPVQTRLIGFLDSLDEEAT